MGLRDLLQRVVGTKAAEGGTQSDADSDNDGLSDAEESALGTDPKHADSDRDGLPDGFEASTDGLSPTNPDTDGDGIDDAVEDSDGDGRKNLAELARGTDIDDAESGGVVLASSGLAPAQLRDAVVRGAAEADVAFEAGDEDAAEAAFYKVRQLQREYLELTGAEIDTGGEEHHPDGAAFAFELTDREYLRAKGIEVVGLTKEQAEAAARVVRDKEAEQADAEREQAVRDYVSDTLGVDVSELSAEELEKLLEANEVALDAAFLDEHALAVDKEDLPDDVARLLEARPELVIPDELKGKILKPDEDQKQRDDQDVATQPPDALVRPPVDRPAQPVQSKDPNPEDGAAETGAPPPGSVRVLVEGGQVGDDALVTNEVFRAPDGTYWYGDGTQITDSAEIEELLETEALVAAETDPEFAPSDDDTFTTPEDQPEDAGSTSDASPAGEGDGGSGDDDDDDDDDASDDTADAEDDRSSGATSEGDDPDGTTGPPAADEGQPTPDGDRVSERGRAEFHDTPVGGESAQSFEDALLDRIGGGLGGPESIDKDGREAFLDSRFGAGAVDDAESAVAAGSGAGFTDPHHFDVDDGSGVLDEVRLKGGGAIDPVEPKSPATAPETPLTGGEPPASGGGAFGSGAARAPQLDELARSEHRDEAGNDPTTTGAVDEDLGGLAEQLASTSVFDDGRIDDIELAVDHAELDVSVNLEADALDDLGD